MVNLTAYMVATTAMVIGINALDHASFQRVKEALQESKVLPPTASYSHNSNHHKPSTSIFSSILTTTDVISNVADTDSIENTEETLSTAGFLDLISDAKDLVSKAAGHLENLNTNPLGATTGIANDVAHAAASAADHIAEGIKDIIDGAADLAAEIANTLTSGVLDSVFQDTKNAVHAVTNVGVGIVNSATDIVDVAVDGAKNAVDGFTNTIDGNFGNNFSIQIGNSYVSTSGLSDIADDVENLVGKSIGDISNVRADPVGSTTGLANNVIDSGTNAVDHTDEGTKDIIDGVTDVAAIVVDGLTGGLTGGITGGAKDIVHGVTDAGDSVINGATGIVDEATGEAKNVIEDTSDTLVGNVDGSASGYVDNIDGNFKQIPHVDNVDDNFDTLGRTIDVVKGPTESVRLNLPPAVAKRAIYDMDGIYPEVAVPPSVSNVYIARDEVISSKTPSSTANAAAIKSLHSAIQAASAKATPTPVLRAAAHDMTEDMFIIPTYGNSKAGINFPDFIKDKKKEDNKLLDMILNDIKSELAASIAHELADGVKNIIAKAAAKASKAVSSTISTETPTLKVDKSPV